MATSTVSHPLNPAAPRTWEGWLRVQRVRVLLILRRDFGLRLISLLLAIGLWFFVNAGQHGGLESYMVPISYGRLPPGYVITNPHPGFTHIQISGPRTLLSLIDPSRLTLRLDLAGATVGQMSYKVGPDAFNVPRQTSVESIAPSQIVLDIDKVVTRTIPIHVPVSGAPARGYKVAAVDVDPTTAEVRGPSRDVNRLDEVEADPVRVDGATADVSKDLRLTPPADDVRLEPTQVAATVTLAPVMANKEFHGVRVEVRDADYKYRLEPERVSLTLHGPTLALAKLDPKGIAYVEADGLLPGFYNSVPVLLNLPDGIDLARQTPQVLKLRMYREKLAATP